MNNTIKSVVSAKKPHLQSLPNYIPHQLVFSKSALLNLPLLDQHLFQKFGTGTITEVPYACIHHAFEDQVTANPQGIAVQFMNDSITYKALNDKANVIAFKLIKSGVKKGDNVGIFLRRSINFVAGILGILKAGACYVPQDAQVATSDYMSSIINQANLKIILTEAKYHHLIPQIKDTEIIEIDTLLSSDKYNIDFDLIPRVDVSENDLCYMIFTSGTTGKPNGVQVTHSNICNLLLTNPGNLGIRPGLKVSQILNIAFDMSVWEILGCLSNGATLVIRGKNIQETVSKVDVVISTPSVLASLDETKCQNVKTVAVAGEPCPRTLAEKWSAFAVFYNSCGPTEITIINTAERFFSGDEILSIGKPTPNNTVYILDEDRKPCKIGEVGEMWAGGKCVTAGYLGNEYLTNERYVDDPFLGKGAKMFRTRDLGKWTRKGELEHLGRTDDQVKIKGFRVELDAISAVAEKLPECRRAVSLKIDKETLATFVTPETIHTTTITEAVKKALPYYYVPKIVKALKELPMTNRGKIDKKILMESLVEQKGNTPEKPIENNTTQNEEQPPVALDNIDLPQQQSWFKRIWKGETLMHYYRLMMLVFLANLALATYGYFKGGWWTAEAINLDVLAKVALINFTLGIIMRQQYVVNLLFKMATSIPIKWSLKIRRRAGKIYHFGGLHVGGTVSGTAWFIAFVGALYFDFFNNTHTIVSQTLLTVTSLLCGILLIMIAFALPKPRAKNHNRFEKSHRFGGWSALLLFWVQMLLLTKATAGELSFGMAVLNSFSFWMLVLITFSIALPWMRLKKVDVNMVRPSNHVTLARFNYGETPFAGSSTVLSRSPLMEWHAFANVPEPGRDGFRLTISRAGDWTGKLIDDQPKKLWVKGITTAGVGNIDKLFKRVVWVATGSGIGPCLPHLFTQEVPALLVWATRSPRITYGDELVDEILAVQPNAIIWDTNKFGKPDMVKLAYKAYKEFDAEAVICISNKKLTWQVVSGMESRDIPAYGAIWDS